MPANLLLLIILSIPVWGYFILYNRFNPGIFSWAITFIFILIIHFYADAEPLLLMFLLIASTFLSLKIVVTNNHLGQEPRLKYIQWLLFCYGWFGMNPRPFLAYPSKKLADYSSYLANGFSRILIGLALINITAYAEPESARNSFSFVFQLFYLIGLSLILHFGILNMFAGFLRWLGINVTSLFKDPIRSRSLNEFWSKRWNLAFVELTAIAVLRPIRNRFGSKIAFWASFIFSGLLHELAISLPVKSGFGKPFLYFVIQAVLIMTLDKYVITRISQTLLRTLLILTCLFAPIFLLFHEQFISGIIIPLVSYLTF